MQVYADDLSTLNFGYATFENATQTTCIANNGSTINVAGLTISGGMPDPNGLLAENGSRIVAETCNISGCYTGVAATYSSFIDVSGGTVSNCQNACQSKYNSTIDAEVLTASSNQSDLYADYNGIIDAFGANAANSTANGGQVFSH